MSDFKEIISELKNFVDENGLKRYNTPKNLSIAAMIECSELMEHFQWKNDQEIEDYILKNKEAIGGELADVANYIFELSGIIGIDLKEMMIKKIKINSEKYKKKSKISN